MQARWQPDPADHEATFLDGIRTAAKAAARIVFLQELTLSRYLADERPANEPNALAEQLPGGPTHVFAAKAAAETRVTVHASVFEKADGADGPDGLGYNTAILVAPDGTLLARTRKLHIPKTAGYYEDHYFRPGPAAANPYPVIDYNDPLISDPYGRVLVSAPRDRDAVLIADLDLDQRRDWLDRLPLLATRRPDSYAALTQSD
ncbi:nitrilase-related carbon-nitrogen hydrolase [Pseudarthrobacter sp. O4]|uniref:nitrilase-related carbon-nitrogen hydrolase n=1 Tax=Pseudarthrobacter sp. O4 TaxID=3418417 RepID=UPI003CEBCBD4